MCCEVWKLLSAWFSAGASFESKRYLSRMLSGQIRESSQYLFNNLRLGSSIRILCVHDEPSEKRRKR